MFSVVFIYEAGTDKLYGLEPIYNEKLHGRCLEGKVVKTNKEYIKMHLDIDKEKKPESELYEFKWMPETGNIMYAMPEKDTVVSLYVGGIDEGDAIVINALRKNEKGKEYEKNENKYFTTASGMRMYVAKEEVGFTSNSNTNSVSDEHGRNTGKAHLNIHDKEGFVIGTEKKIYMEADKLIEIKEGSKLTINGEKLVQIRKDKNAVKLKNKISVIGKKSPFVLGMGVPETIEGGETVTIKNTGQGVGNKKLTDEQSKINEMFRGDQFKVENSFSASIEPQLRSDLAQVNKNCTCVFEENIKKSVVKNNDSYYKRFNDKEVELKSKLAEKRSIVPDVTEDTIMQKVIGKWAYDDYILGTWNSKTCTRGEKKKTAGGCISRAQDAAPYTSNAEQAYKVLRLDYAGSEFKGKVENGEEVYVMRCKCDYRPTNDEYMKVDAANPWNKPPCTGQGFVGDDNELIPEFTYGRDGQQITSGAIYQIDKDGNEYLAAYWDGKNFVEVK